MSSPGTSPRQRGRPSIVHALVPSPELPRIGGVSSSTSAPSVALPSSPVSPSVVPAPQLSSPQVAPSPSFALAPVSAPQLSKSARMTPDERAAAFAAARALCLPSPPAEALVAPAAPSSATSAASTAAAFAASTAAAAALTPLTPAAAGSLERRAPGTPGGGYGGVGGGGSSSPRFAMSLQPPLCSPAGGRLPPVFCPIVIISHERLSARWRKRFFIIFYLQLVHINS